MNAKIRREAERIIQQHMEMTYATEGPVVQRMIEGYRKRLLKTSPTTHVDDGSDI
ncbi:MAG: hypothetical protein V1857_05645 [archaeon]